MNQFIQRLYKNKVEQRPGWDDEVLAWCCQQAKEKALKAPGYWGGFVIDEMKIQVCAELSIIINNIFNYY